MVSNIRTRSQKRKAEKAIPRFSFSFFKCLSLLHRGCTKYLGTYTPRAWPRNHGATSIGHPFNHILGSSLHCLFVLMQSTRLLFPRLVDSLQIHLHRLRAPRFMTHVFHVARLEWIECYPSRGHGVPSHQSQIIKLVYPSAGMTWLSVHYNYRRSERTRTADSANTHISD